jgi:hypothetical protein
VAGLELLSGRVDAYRDACIANVVLATGCRISEGDSGTSSHHQKDLVNQPIFLTVMQTAVECAGMDEDFSVLPQRQLRRSLLAWPSVD